MPWVSLLVPSTSRVFLTLLLVLFDAFAQHVYDYNPDVKEYTRQIVLKQGILHGVVVQPKVNQYLRPVEQYLGIPYAAPPVGKLRFMPPGSAPSWFGTKYADFFGPVCPQRMPDVVDMRPERRKFFEGLAQYLTNQSEDCLYLNVYAPLQSAEERNKYPVMVFIHGESYEWNSGNPYDGTVLASYGRVIVVTLNYRLGILGFLKAGLEESSYGNFGLVDQIAALLWVQESIEAFGGDPDKVTVFGHGTGAACTSLLMLSPMVQVQEKNKLLFQRAILMGGTALSDWALARNPRQVTYQVAQALNCRIDDDFLACLRRKRLDEIMEASAVTSAYKTRFGPVIDASVIPNEPEVLMTKYNHLFSRFDLMLGVTEIESLHLLNSIALTYGMLERERDQELKKYLSVRCEMKLELCVTRTLAEYVNEEFALQNERFPGFAEHMPDKALTARDALLDALSDARSVAPLVRTAEYHAPLRPDSESFFYVFARTTASKENIRGQTFHGEELPYVFGIPLDGPKYHFMDRYTAQEQLLSEVMMTYWTNFAYEGNPNVPKKEGFVTLTSIDWSMFDVDWPSFDVEKQQFLYLAIPPKIGFHYRQKQMKFWNNILPQILSNYTVPPELYETTTTKKPKAKKPFFLTDKFSMNYGQPYQATTSPILQMQNKPADVFGTIKLKPEPEDPGEPIANIETIERPVTKEPESKHGSTMNVLIIIGGVFLLINMFLFIGLYYKCVRMKKRNNTEKEATEDSLEAVDEGEKKTSKPMFEQDGCNLIRIISKASKSEDPYEPIKVGDGASSSKVKLTRQMSNSTIDAHTKVRDWIAHEVVYRCSPRFFRRGRPDAIGIESNSTKPDPEPRVKPPLVRSDTKTVESTSTLGRSPTRPASPINQAPLVVKTLGKPVERAAEKQIKKAQKISVAVDATPSGRGSSVLRQQPIELTKSLDYPTQEKDVDVPLRRSVTMDDICNSPKLNMKSDSFSKSTANINVKLQQPSEPTVVKIKHFHSNSDPVQDLYAFANQRKLKTFDPDADINVTSRDEVDHYNPALTPEQALMTIKRRNFPKVLPDYPSREDMMHKRRSMPAHNMLFFPIPELSSISSQPTSPSEKIYCRFKPVPPPRISSTLGRKATPPSATPVFISSPVLAEEPPIPEEPEITCNNLYVGPLVRSKPDYGSTPHTLNTQPVYDTLRPSKSLDEKSEKQGPKTIITTDPNNPVKRVEPKVIIKPTISRSNNSSKGIARVTASDNVSNINTNRTNSKGSSTHEAGSSSSNPSVNKREEAGEGVNETQSSIPVKVQNNKAKAQKPSQIPIVKSQNKESSSSESTTPSDESDTGTVKRIA